MAGTRVAVVASFVLFVLLAAPLAWQLTRVERHPLPSARIRRLAAALSAGGGGSASEAEPPLTVAVYARASAVVEPPRIGGVVFERRKLLADPAAFPVDEARRQDVDERLHAVVARARSPAALSVLLLCPPGEAAAESDAQLVVGKHRHAWARACDLRQGSALARAVARLVREHLVGGSERADTAGTARLALQYRLQFTLLKEDPAASWTWDAAALAARYWRPMLRKVSLLADWTEESQVAQFARLAREVHRGASVDAEPFFFVTADDLKHFKSANDLPAAAVLADREQVLHFMAALPTEAHAPLVIHDSSAGGRKEPGPDGATAFEIPGWGLVAILDPRRLTGGQDARERELRRVMGLFVAQFRRLLGAPAFSERQRLEDARAREAPGEVPLVFLPSTVDGLADWELDAMVRARFRSLVRSTVETLASIDQLVDAMPEMSVLERVQQPIAAAAALLEEILCMRDGREPRDRAPCAAGDVEARLRLAREAAALADAAYYDHTMTRQLYFPQEQMLGVYAPLLAPLILPFFLGLVRELKRWRLKRSAKREKPKAE